MSDDDTSEVSEKIDATKEMVCLLIPTMALPMVVPNVVVAEVLLHAVVQPDERFVWHVGWVHWRGVVVPVVNYEHLNDDERSMAVNHVDKIAIFHAVGTQGAYAYYAVCLAASPKLMTITSSEIVEEQTSESVMEGALVDIDGVEAVIPDLVSLERRLQALKVPNDVVFEGS